jgi:hypothetical protein
MSRTYAAKRLLEHGPLTFPEFVGITGWSRAQAATTLNALDKSGLLSVTGNRMKFVYALATGDIDA